jgi:hypothetical protein
LNRISNTCKVCVSRERLSQFSSAKCAMSRSTPRKANRFCPSLCANTSSI